MIEGTLTKTGATGLGGELPGQVFYGIQGPPGRQGPDGGYYTLDVKQLDEDTVQFTFTPSKPDMPIVEPVTVELPASQDPGGNVDLEGYATEQWVKDQKYLTEVPEGYAKDEDIPTKPEDIGAQPSGNYALKSEIPSVPVQSVNGKTGKVQLSAAEVGARPDNWMPTAQEVGALPSTYTPPNQTAEQVGADPKGTAVSAVSQHNTAEDSHNDIRLELKAINDRLTAFFDSDNQTLDELSEIVAYITSNKSLIDAITTSKVSVTDIVNNLTSNVANKPLSAAQGVVLKGLIDAVSNSLASYALKSEIPTKVSKLQNDSGYLTQHQDISGLLPRTELPTAINTALEQAKQSGEFNGENGTSVTVKKVTESTEDGGSNVVEFSDGKTITVKNGRKGAPYELTDTDKATIVDAVIEALPVYAGEVV